MGKASRDKGARGENEFAEMLSKILGIKIKRQLGQARDGGADILDVPHLVIEVKRWEKLSVPSWWTQVLIASKEKKRVPVLAFRRNNENWRVAVPPRFFNPRLEWLLLDHLRVELTLNEFCHIYKSIWMKGGK